jgi:hypothetical protein
MRDTFFQELFGRPPNAEESQRLEKIALLMGLKQDDAMWYVILVNEFYDDRLKNRLVAIDRIADNTAQKALERIAVAVNEKAAALATRKDKASQWRSWGFLMSLVVLFCAVAQTAGYMMGSGRYPFWFEPETDLQRMASWVLNVPSGWILFMGSGPFLAEIFSSSVKRLLVDKYLGLTFGNMIMVLKAVGSLAALMIILFLVLSVY